MRELLPLSCLCDKPVSGIRAKDWDMSNVSGRALDVGHKDTGVDFKKGRREKKSEGELRVLGGFHSLT